MSHPVRQEGRVAPLSPKLKKMVEGLGQGMSTRAACAHAGLKYASRYADDPRVVAAVAEVKRQNAEAAALKRDDIIDGLKEAVQLAKQVSDPHALIKAWSELGRLCGFYAPEVKKIDISVTAKRVISQMETLTEAELLQLANEELGTTFEGHFKRVSVPSRALPGPVEDAEIVSEDTK